VKFSIDVTKRCRVSFLYFVREVKQICKKRHVRAVAHAAGGTPVDVFLDFTAQQRYSL